MLVGALIVSPLHHALALDGEVVADITARVLDSVVMIETTKAATGDQNAKDKPQNGKSIGAGLVVDPSGLVATANSTVVADADEVVVTLNDGTKVKGEVVGRDPKTDVALLRVKTDKPLTPVTFGNSDALRLGQRVIAIGNPFGLGFSVTAGIVSGLHRNINAGPYDNYIQIDAALNKGNSGGPLLNFDGEVVGINSAIYSPSGGWSGIGFAIPANLAVPVIQQLRAAGEVRRGWLGVQIQQVTAEIAEAKGLDRARGALVVNVTDGGPAQAGGLAQGDVLIRFDGKDIGQVRDLPRIVAATPIGKAVEVVVIRGGAEVTKTVTLGDLKDAVPPPQSPPAAPQPGLPPSSDSQH